MRKLVGVMALAAMAAAATHAGARPERPVLPAIRSIIPSFGVPGDPLGRMQGWRTAVATWSGAVQAFGHEQTEVVESLDDGVTTALTFSDHRDAVDGRLWADSWIRARGLQLDGLKGRSQLQDPPTPPAGIAGDAQTLRLSIEMRGLTAVAASVGEADLALAREIVPLIAKAAGGDVDAARALRVRRHDLTIARLRNENVTIQAAREVLAGASPESDIGACSIDSNLAMIALLDLRKVVAADPAVDRSPFIRKMRSQATAARQSAKQASLDAVAALAALGDQSDGFEAGSLESLAKVLPTFQESADVETAIADALLDAADRLAKGEALESPRVAGLMTGLQSYVAKRVALDQRRRQIIAGQTP